MRIDGGGGFAAMHLSDSEQGAALQGSGVLSQRKPSPQGGLHSPRRIDGGGGLAATHFFECGHGATRHGFTVSSQVKPSPQAGSQSPTGIDGCGGALAATHFFECGHGGSMQGLTVSSQVKPSVHAGSQPTGAVAAGGGGGADFSAGQPHSSTTASQGRRIVRVSHASRGFSSTSTTSPSPFAPRSFFGTANSVPYLRSRQTLVSHH